MTVNLEEGLGISLVNKSPEELVFATLFGVDIHFTRTVTNEVLELSVQNIQVSHHTIYVFYSFMLKIHLIPQKTTLVAKHFLS